MTNKPKPVRQLSPAARRVRAGVAGFAGARAPEARAFLARLRDDLDAINGNDRLTASEKAARAKQAVAALRERWRFVVQAAADDLAAASAAARRVDEAVRGVEAVSPVQALRLQLAAQALGALPAAAARRDFEAAFASRDLQRMLAHSLVAPLDDGGRRAIAVLVASADMQTLIDSGRDATAHALATREAEAALAELEGADDPHAEARPDSRDLLNIANSGAAAFRTREEIESAVPADAPSWLRSLLVPARPALKPMQADAPASQDGAA
jgi:hypothetical protein